NITKERTQRTNSEEVTEVYSEYDILGRRIRLSSNLGADISYELDKLSNISKITAGDWEAKIDYDKLGLEIQRELTGNVTNQTRRDRLGRMRHQTARSDYGTLLWKEYQWGVDYRLYDIIDHAYKDRDASFEYDDRGYLVRAIYDRKKEQFRTADKLGNLYETKNKTDRKYTNSQLQQDRSYYYHYDVEGNLIFKEHIKDVGYRPVFSGGELRDLGIQPKSTGKGILYTWNANGSLRSVTDLQGTTYRFRYDAFGRRIEKRRMASTFRFVWDGNVLLHETFKKDNSEHTEVTTWVFEGFVPTAKLVNGKAYSIISDHLGTPILAIDSDGMEVWNRQLDIYGRVRKEYKHSSLGDEVFPFVPFLYQGQYYDFETNLAYNRFRYYSPETGTYISQDPIRLWGGKNLYVYIEDPNILVDIFGLRKVKPSKTIGQTNIYGKGQVTGPGHSPAMINIADEVAKSGNFKEVYLNLSWNTANHTSTGTYSDISRLRPDLILIDNDNNKISIEVASKTDKLNVLQQRNEDANKDAKYVVFEYEKDYNNDGTLTETGKEKLKNICSGK
ncbi:RHS repeat-associated core domain-containing protein, partial [Capnocytophaga gingivalis]|uniref:RHS repeat domain-containing protein n=1 Tax=Capnocytophaga gingivalis TaxID=1017 RepID=UPI0028E9E458